MQSHAIRQFQRRVENAGGDGPSMQPLPSMSNERLLLAQEVAQVEQWWKVRISSRTTSGAHEVSKCPRFARVKRPYTAADVVAKRGTIPIQYPSNIQGQKLWSLLSEHAGRRTVSHTYGA